MKTDSQPTYEPNTKNLVLGKTLNDIISDLRSKQIDRTSVNTRNQYGERLNDRDPSRIFLRNDTGQPFTLGNVYEVGDAITTPDENLSAYNNQNTFKGKASGPLSSKIAIAQYSTPNTDAFTEAIMLGVTLANVHVSDITHGFAKPGVTPGELVSSGSETNICILDKSQTGTGFQPCKVFLGFSAERPHAFVTLTQDITSGSSAPAQTIEDAGGTVLDTTTVFNSDGPDAVSGSRYRVEKIDGQWYTDVWGEGTNDDQENIIEHGFVFLNSQVAGAVDNGNGTHTPAAASTLFLRQFNAATGQIAATTTQVTVRNANVGQVVCPGLWRVEKIDGEWFFDVDSPTLLFAVSNEPIAKVQESGISTLTWTPSSKTAVVYAQVGAGIVATGETIEVFNTSEVEIDPETLFPIFTSNCRWYAIAPPTIESGFVRLTFDVQAGTFDQPAVADSQNVLQYDGINFTQLDFGSIHNTDPVKLRQDGLYRVHKHQGIWIFDSHAPEAESGFVVLTIDVPAAETDTPTIANSQDILEYDGTTFTNIDFGDIHNTDPVALSQGKRYRVHKHEGIWIFDSHGGVSQFAFVVLTADLAAGEVLTPTMLTGQNIQEFDGNAFTSIGFADVFNTDPIELKQGKRYRLVNHDGRWIVDSHGAAGDTGFVRLTVDLAAGTATTPTVLGGQNIQRFDGTTFSIIEFASVYNTDAVALKRLHRYRVTNHNGLWIIDSYASVEHSFAMVSDRIPPATVNGDGTISVQLGGPDTRLFLDVDDVIKPTTNVIEPVNTSTTKAICPGLHRVDYIGGRWVVDADEVINMFAAHDGTIAAATKSDGPPPSWTPTQVANVKLFARIGGSGNIVETGATATINNASEVTIESGTLFPIFNHDCEWFTFSQSNADSHGFVVLENPLSKATENNDGSVTPFESPSLSLRRYNSDIDRIESTGEMITVYNFDTNSRVCAGLHRIERHQGQWFIDSSIRFQMFASHVDAIDGATKNDGPPLTWTPRSEAGVKLYARDGGTGNIIDTGVTAVVFNSSESEIAAGTLFPIFQHDCEWFAFTSVSERQHAFVFLENELAGSTRTGNSWSPASQPNVKFYEFDGTAITDTGNTVRVFNSSEEVVVGNSIYRVDRVDNEWWVSPTETLGSAFVVLTSDMPAGETLNPTSLAAQTIQTFNGSVFSTIEVSEVYNTDPVKLKQGKRYRLERHQGLWIVDSHEAATNQHSFVFLTDRIPPAIDNGDGTVTVSLSNTVARRFLDEDDDTIKTTGENIQVANANPLQPVCPGLHRIELIDGRWVVDTDDVVNMFASHDGTIPGATKTDGPPPSWSPSTTPNVRLYARTGGAGSIVQTPITATINNAGESEIASGTLFPIFNHDCQWFAYVPESSDGHSFALTPSELPSASRTGNSFTPGMLGTVFRYKFENGTIDNTAETIELFNAHDTVYPANMLYRIEMIDGQWWVDPIQAEDQHTFVFVPSRMDAATMTGNNITPTLITVVELYQFGTGAIVPTGQFIGIANYNTNSAVFPGLHRVELIDGVWCVDANSYYDLFVRVATGGVPAATRTGNNLTPGVLAGNDVYFRHSSGDLQPIGTTLEVLNYQEQDVAADTIQPVAFMEGSWFVRSGGGSTNRVRFRIADTTKSSIPAGQSEVCTVLHWTVSDPGPTIEIDNTNNIPGFEGWAEYSAFNEVWEVTEGQTGYVVKITDIQVEGRSGDMFGTGSGVVMVRSGTTDTFVQTARQITVHNYSGDRTGRGGQQLVAVIWCFNAWIVVANDCLDFSTGNSFSPGVI